MATYWTGSKKISKAQYDAIQAKHAAWTGPKVVDAPTPTRQPSGKQPVSDPVDSSWSAWQKIKEGLVAAGKQPDQAAADRKRMEEHLAVAATHGKEIVFEFSKPVSSKANTYVSKLVKLLGGKRSYIENQTKLVVVM